MPGNAGSVGTSQGVNAGGKPPSRRRFLTESSLLVGGTVASALSIESPATASWSDEIRIGLVGCGVRGTSATIQALASDCNIKLIALCDLNQHRILSAMRAIKGRFPEKVDVNESHRFVGFDGFRRLLECDVHVVLFATPPAFRPSHFEAAVDCGKHVFMEKPVATDPPGFRRVLKSNEIAKGKGLSVQVGLQRHYQSHYRSIVSKIQDGCLGDILFARAYWNGPSPRTKGRMPNQSELEFQLENWNHFNWLSGGPICEQQIHNLDVINWVLGGHPIEAQGQGGWYSRENASIGDAFDHHFLEFTYRSGVKLMAQSRQWDGCWSAIGEFVHGTRGSADLANGKIFDRDGRLIEHFPKTEDGFQQTQKHFLSALRCGVYVNNLDMAAASTMTAIMGRMAIQTGLKVSWESCMRCNDQLAVIDQLATLQDVAPAIRNSDGMYQVKAPGDGKSQYV